MRLYKHILRVIRRHLLRRIYARAVDAQFRVHRRVAHARFRAALIMQRDFVCRRRRLGVIPFHICRAVVHHLFAKKLVFLLLALAKRRLVAQQLFRLRVRRNLALIQIVAIGDFKLYVHALV